MAGWLYEAQGRAVQPICVNNAGHNDLRKMYCLFGRKRGSIDMLCAPRMINAGQMYRFF